MRSHGFGSDGILVQTIFKLRYITGMCYATVWAIRVTADYIRSVKEHKLAFMIEDFA